MAIALTSPPFSNVLVNTLKSISLTASAISFNSMSNLISGFSEPYLAIDSFQVIRCKGNSRSISKVSFMTRFNKPSVKS